MSIEHGLFASEETFKTMKEKGVFFSTQFLALSLPPEKAGMKGPSVEKYLQAQAGAQLSLVITSPSVQDAFVRQGQGEGFATSQTFYTRR